LFSYQSGRRPEPSATVEVAISEGRVPHQQREAWTCRMAEYPKMTIEVLADLEPRRDLAEAAWWDREGGTRHRNGNDERRCA
jgi:hypothetical protein